MPLRVIEHDNHFVHLRVLRGRGRTNPLRLIHEVRIIAPVCPIVLEDTRSRLRLSPDIARRIADLIDAGLDARQGPITLTNCDPRDFEVRFSGGRLHLTDFDDAVRLSLAAGDMKALATGLRIAADPASDRAYELAAESRKRARSRTPAGCHA